MDGDIDSRFEQTVAASRTAVVKDWARILFLAIFNAGIYFALKTGGLHEPTLTTTMIVGLLLVALASIGPLTLPSAINTEARKATQILRNAGRSATITFKRQWIFAGRGGRYEWQVVTESGRSYSINYPVIKQLEALEGSPCPARIYRDEDTPWLIVIEMNGQALWARDRQDHRSLTVRDVLRS